MIVESGEPREVHHFALLCGYGANAINPYVAYETLAFLTENGFLLEIKDYKIVKKNFVKAVSKGLLQNFQ